MKVIVLGGYGHFGSIISRRLAAIAGFDVIVAGRDAARAASHAAVIGARAARLDASDAAFAPGLGAHAPDLVIHAAGPFQGTGYAVARAAVASGAHYIDIADGRAFVCGIGAVDAAARQARRRVVSGASSVPALSSAVIDRYAREFASVREIDIGISAGGGLPGAATVEAVLGYCGKAFPVWQEGAWGATYGWQGLRRHRFRGSAGTRWFCDCDVPDLEIFPGRYAGVRAVRFGAGLELSAMHLGLWALSGLVRSGIVAQLRSSRRFLESCARWLVPFAAGRGAMYVRIAGISPDGRERARTWELQAEQGDGATIPCLAAVALARKWAATPPVEGGATPAVGVLELSEYLAELEGLRVRVAEM